MTEHPTLVVHGFLTNKITNMPVHLALRRKGLRTYNVPIPGWNTQDMRKSSELLGVRAREILDKTGADKVNIVGISMGGVITVHYVRCQDGHELLNRAVTLGAPINGTPVVQAVRNLPVFGTAAQQMAPDSPIIQDIHREPLPDADIVSIYADGDSVVPAEAARLKNARNVKAPVGNWPLGHYQLVTDPRNLNFVAEELLRQD